MKIKRKLCLILIFVLILSLAGCKKGKALSEDNLMLKDYNGIDINKINEYKIEVELNEEEKSYTGKQWVTYVNNTGIDLKEIYFHVYPNAFKSLDKAPILFNQGEGMEPLEYEPGYMDLEKVLMDKDNLRFNIQGQDDTILHIQLNKPLKKGEKATIYFKYKVYLPTSKDRFGYGEKAINFGNWYPIVCVYDKKGWNLDPYYSIGDPFYSDISNYKVNITTPKEVVVAASGNILSEKIEGDKKTYIIEGKLLRDFAWAASKDFIVNERKVGDTLIRLYTLKDNDSMIEYSLNVGEESISLFSRLFGKYPYSQYSIVITEFPSGMEYPGLVFIGDDYFYNSLKSILEKIIVHETAHQWWYGLVGNNQVDEAWLDESLATYSEVIYTKEVYGEKEGEEYYNQNIKIGYDHGVKYLGENGVVKKPLNEFTGWDDYGILVYTKGAIFINEIKEEYGEETLYDILNKYFHTYKFYNATTEDFIKICENVTKDSFKEKVDRWLLGGK
ncbi:M1 family metallopeptidase [Tissierella sp. MSJ-40]|uniref:M1 family metallopeptidase n=1 Tax=Tissierella simiarum TaxID=2841534 RepID=A0ABS6E8X0_9FIRM|nr:M1 family metallopeptidase [Tissierella simiarum]MBU5439367.1 M1 family metallopeptidase [Tissierella simiarum]